MAYSFSLHNCDTATCRELQHGLILVNGAGCSSLHRGPEELMYSKNLKGDAALIDLCVPFIFWISGDPNGWTPTHHKVMAYPSDMCSLYKTGQPL